MAREKLPTLKEIEFAITPAQGRWLAAKRERMLAQLEAKRDGAMLRKVARATGLAVGDGWAKLSQTQSARKARTERVRAQMQQAVWTAGGDLVRDHYVATIGEHYVVMRATADGWSVVGSLLAGDGRIYANATVAFTAEPLALRSPSSSPIIPSEPSSQVT